MSPHELTRSSLGMEWDIVCYEYALGKHGGEK